MSGRLPTPYDEGLDRNAANFVPLSPIAFLERAELVHPDKVAVRHGAVVRTWGEFARRCRALAHALSKRGIGRGDTVAIMAPNIPAMLEAHYGVPAIGAVLNALNIRLDAATLAHCLVHGKARVLITDAEFAPVMREALHQVGHELLVVDIDDPEGPGHGDPAARAGTLRYEELLAEGDPAFAWPGIADEWDAITLSYTSGTTGNPKGVVYHHRGAYLNALGNALAFGLRADSAYLWTLPMFHCNGWTYTWAVTAVAGTHVCLRKVEAARVFEAIEKHGVTHMCGAPVVLGMLIHSRDEDRRPLPHRVEVATGGAAPPSAVIEAMERLGFHVTHLYGLTESYGPATLCEPQESWDALDLEARAARMARQGVPMPTLAGVALLDTQTGTAVPRDGTTLGEVALRGNTIMKGYLANPAATQAAFEGGWFHSGDLAVWHPDGYIEIKDRSKDIIISGGENISSIEVEECLYRHPAVMEVAVVAHPDARWGEVPCAFVSLKPGATAAAEELVGWCRERIARFKVPRHVVFGPLPKTATGKIQKNVLRDRVRGGQ